MKHISHLGDDASDAKGDVGDGTAEAAVRPGEAGEGGAGGSSDMEEEGWPPAHAILSVLLSLITKRSDDDDGCSLVDNEYATWLGFLMECKQSSISMNSVQLK